MSTNDVDKLRKQWIFIYSKRQLPFTSTTRIGKERI